MSLINNILTGKDNTTHDVVRVLGVISFFTGLGLVIYSVGWKGQVFDLTNFGIGVGAMFTGMGIGIKLKENTEPTQLDDNHS